MTTTDVPSPLALRPRDAAKALGVSARTLWALTAPRGPVPCVRVGAGRRQTVLYPVDQLRAWLAREAAAVHHALSAARGSGHQDGGDSAAAGRLLEEGRP
jgi:hypothetical protein